MGFFSSIRDFVRDPVGTLTGTTKIQEGMEAQAEAYGKAAGITKEMSEKARNDILAIMAPALIQYGKAINNSIGEIKSGRADVIDTFNKSTNNAYQILSNSGMDAKRIMMGAEARQKGVPKSTFEREYQAVKNLPVKSYSQAQQMYRQGGSNVRGRPLEDDYIRDPEPDTPDRGTRPGQDRYQDNDKDDTYTQGGTSQQASPTLTGQPIESQEGTGSQNLQDIIAAIAGPPGETRGGPLKGKPIPGWTEPTPQMQIPQEVQDTFIPEGIGYGPARQALEKGYGQAAGFMERGIDTARGDIYKGLEGALQRTGQATDVLTDAESRSLERFQPYSTAGAGAIEKEAALSGAMGPEAQQQAIDSYIESPGQKYLREQQEKALLRSSSAIGGLGGGTVRSALQKQAMNIASTQQQQHLENLRSIAMRGQGVAGQEVGVIQGTAAGKTGILGHEAELITGAERIRADLARQLGISQADLSRMSGKDLSSLAERAGINVAGLEQQIGLGKSGLIQTLGQQVAGAQGSSAEQIANLLSQGGAGTLSASQNISQLLSNLATGQGTNLANIAIGQGQGQAAGLAAQGQATSSFLQNALLASMLMKRPQTPTATTGGTV